MPEGLLVILRTETPRDDASWKLVLPADVPEWVKEPDNMARLVAGDMCSKPEADEFGWYRAEKVSSDGETKQ